MTSVHITLCPRWADNTVSSLAVRIDTDLTAKSGEPLFRIQSQSYDKPFLEREEDFRASDFDGTIPLETAEQQEGAITYRIFLPTREGQGPVRIAYRVKVAPAGRNPVLDFGAEEGGAAGSGMTFLPAFFTEGEIDCRLTWDLAEMPARSVGAWSFGEGDVRRRGDDKTFSDTFYACGLLDSVRVGNFRYWWFSNDALLSTAADAGRIFREEARFFGDAGEPYAIFARHVPFSVKAGGTAQTRSYLFLYRDLTEIGSYLQFLFAHEMVHNWVSLPDEPYGTCTWYVEGMAEFYSTVLPYRMGIVTPEELVKELNSRAADYYENPKIGAPNLTCGENFLADLEMTKVPYGRGFFYLTSADAAIRRATSGERCLDDVMRALLGKTVGDGNEAWIAEYGRYVGADTARREYEFLRDGGICEPSADCFPGIGVRRREGVVRGTGEPCAAWEFYAE